MLKRKKSEKLFQKAKTYFPGGVNSPVRAFKSVGGVPLFIEKGKGSHIWDADGNRYIDYCCSWGPLILGHSHPAVVKSIVETAKSGTSFGAPTRLENELAGLILNHNRYIDKIRFVSSGTEAVMSAIRLARGYTGRTKIIKFEGCYHGHADSMLVNAGSGLATLGISSSSGVTETVARETIVLPLNDKQALKSAFNRHKKDIACVIIEPVPANNGLLLQDRSFLEFLHDICASYGAMLIFDEVISGFRLGFTGAAGYYNIHPDIITYGKVIGGGLPVGAYGARADVMKRISPDGNVYQAGTLSGNPVAMAAGIAQLSECLKGGFYDKLQRKTKRLAEGIIPLLKDSGTVCHIGSIFWIAFTKRKTVSSSSEIDPNSMLKFKLLHAALLERGIYLGPSGYEVAFISSAHTDRDIDDTIKAFKDAIDITST